MEQVPKEFKFRVHESIKELDRDVYNQFVVDQDIFYRYEWMQHTESSYAEKTMIFALYEQDRLLAVTCGYVTSDRASYFYQSRNILTSRQFMRLEDANGEIGEAVARVKHVAARLTGLSEDVGVDELLSGVRTMYQDLLYPCIVIRNGHESPIIVDPNLSPNVQEEVRVTLLESMETYAWQHGFKSISFLYGSLADQNLFTKRGYVSARLSGNLSINTSEFTSLEDYISQLEPKRRQIVRREMRRFAEFGFEKRHLQLGEVIEEIANLEYNNLAKHGNPRTIESILKGKRQLAHIFGDALRVYGYFLNGEMVASVVGVKLGDHYTLMSIGFDYEKTNKSYAYPNLIFYQPVIEAIEEKIPYIHYGMEAFEVKMMRGATLEDSCAYVQAESVEGKQFLEQWLPLVDSNNRKFLGELHRRFDKQGEGGFEDDDRG